MLQRPPCQIVVERIEEGGVFVRAPLHPGLAKVHGRHHQDHLNEIIPVDIFEDFLH